MKTIIQFLYYLNFHLCVVAMTLSAASSRVLNGKIDWRAIVIVGLGTYVIYNFDNMVDWSEESHLFEAIKPWRNAYKICCILTIPISLAIILIFSLMTHVGFILFLIGVGLISGTYVVITFLIKDRKNSIGVLHVAHIFDALMWAIIIVLIPIQYGRYPFVVQTAMAIAYTWLLTWVSVMAWDLSYTAQSGGNSHTVASVMGESRFVSVTQLACVSALILAIIDILLGYFPWYNLSVIGWPIFSYLMLAFWPKLHRTPRFFNFLFCSVNVLGSLLVIVTYYFFG
jgi:hypothetical protein